MRERTTRLLFRLAADSDFSFGACILRDAPHSGGHGSAPWLCNTILPAVCSAYEHFLVVLYLRFGGVPVVPQFQLLHYIGIPRAAIYARRPLRVV